MSTLALPVQRDPKRFLVAPALIFILARWTSSVYYMYLAPLVMAGVTLTLAAEREERTPRES